MPWNGNSFRKYTTVYTPLCRWSSSFSGRQRKIYSIIIIIIIIGIQPLGRSGQRPEFSQATGMALVRCILGKFLSGSLPLLSPRFFYMFPLFNTRCLHVCHDVRDPSGGSGNCGRECCPVILSKWRLPCHLGIFYMLQIYDMGHCHILIWKKKLGIRTVKSVHQVLYFFALVALISLSLSLSLALSLQHARTRTQRYIWMM